MDAKGKETKPRFGIVNFERRKYPRFSIDLPIEYYQIDTPTGHYGRAANISEGGLLIYLPEKVEIGQHLKLRLFLASLSEFHSIEVLAKVVWMETRMKEGLGYPCGVKFIDISSENLTRLEEFLKSLSK